MTRLEFLARGRFKDLSAAEIKLFDSASVGEHAVCGSSDNLNAPSNQPSEAEKWDASRSIRGEIISWVCTDREAKQLVAPGGVQIFGARIIGEVKLLSAQIDFPLVFACCELGDINLQSSNSRILSFMQTYLQSIYADGAVIAGAFLLRYCRAALLQFLGARIEGQFDCDCSSFSGLLLDGAAINTGVLLRRAEGQVKMSRARIGGDLDCSGASFKTANGSPDPALEASGVKVDGSVFLRHGFGAVGSVRLLGAHIGSNLECTRGEFTPGVRTDDKTRPALLADSVVVQGTVILGEKFRAHGDVSFISCQVVGDFNCDHSEFDSGLAIERADIGGTFFWRSVTLTNAARLDLLNTSVGSLGDDSASWPARGNLQIHGFEYKQISVASPKDAKSRLDWLGRQDSYSRQPYRQLASVMKDYGNEKDSREVLYRMECLSEAQENPSAVDSVWNWALKYVVGYGYYPFRALWWFLGLVLVGFLLFRAGFYAGSVVPSEKDAYTRFTQERTLPGHYERFHAFIYSVENSFPLLKLGQEDLWQPDPAVGSVRGRCHSRRERAFHKLVAPNSLRWFRWGQILAGWILATMWIAGLAGLVRRD